MKVRKNGIEIAIDPKDKKRYVAAGWEVKFERTPELRRKYYENRLKKVGKNNDKE